MIPPTPGQIPPGEARLDKGISHMDGEETIPHHPRHQGRVEGSERPLLRLVLGRLFDRLEQLLIQRWDRGNLFTAAGLELFVH